MSKEQKEDLSEAPKKKQLIAKKDFKFKHGKDVYEIIKGEVIDIPKMFHANLKTEKVI